MGLVAVGANLRSAPNAWLEITSHAGDDDEDDDDGDDDGGDGKEYDGDDGDGGRNWKTCQGHNKKRLGCQTCDATDNC